MKKSIYFLALLLIIGICLLAIPNRVFSESLIGIRSRTNFITKDDSGATILKDSKSAIIPSRPEVTETKQGEQTFEYHQKPLHKKVSVKSPKFRLAIAEFEQRDIVRDNTLVLQEGKSGTKGKTAVDIQDSDVTITIDETQIEEDELPESKILTGLLTNALRETRVFEVIERKDIKKIIGEINFQNSKYVKKENLASLGNVHAIQYVVSGDLLRNKGTERVSESYYTLSLRIYDLNTGQIVSSTSVSAGTIKQAAKKTAENLAAEFQDKPWTCRVIGVSNEGIYVNAGLNDNLEEDDRFYVYRLGKKIVDPQTKEVLGYSKIKAGIVEVREVMDDKLARIESVEKYEEFRVGDIVAAEPPGKSRKSERELWQKIFGRGMKIKLTDTEIDNYIYSPDEISPEQIMQNFGMAVVTIQSGNGGLGSGFIVSNDGYVVTNFHVVDSTGVIRIKMIDKAAYFTDIKLVKANPEHDIALLKINSNDDFPTVILGNSDNIRIGEWVVAIGNPKGLENTISDGLISGIREVRNLEVIQTSVPVTHGSSGGPLLNSQGEVIGVVTAGLEQEGNLNFAIPINYVRDELINF